MAAHGATAACCPARNQARGAALSTMMPNARYLAPFAGAAPARARLPQGLLARFLGITPVAFLCIKRRLRGVSGGS
ncbi:MAG: hypothetical protein RL216_772 [Pseudomonadota bacterium]